MPAVLAILFPSVFLVLDRWAYDLVVCAWDRKQFLVVRDGSREQLVSITQTAMKLYSCIRTVFYLACTEPSKVPLKCSHLLFRKETDMDRPVSLFAWCEPCIEGITATTCEIESGGGLSEIGRAHV